jgi:outer membrane biosynthesis protein TonB
MRILPALALTVLSLGCVSSEAARSTQRPCLSQSTRPPVTTEPSKQFELVGGLAELHRHLVAPKSTLTSKTDVRVVVDFIVDEQGCTRDYTLAEGTDQELASAGVYAIQQSAFVPAELNGEPVPVKVRLPFTVRK